MARALSKRLHHYEDWRALATINAYRCFIALGLVGTQFSPLLQPLVETTNATLFETTALLYLLCSGLAVACTILRRPRLRAQVGIFSILDISFISCLCFAGTGVLGGLGALLIVPVACAGALLSARMALFIAAFAALAVLFQEGLRTLVFAPIEGTFFHAGILGGLFFIVAALAQWLAHRIRATQAMVAAHSRTVRNLTVLNQRIIEQMETGAVAVDGAFHIQLINAAAMRLLQLTSEPQSNTALSAALPVVHDALTAWLRLPGGNARSIEVSGHSLLITFSVLPMVDDRARGAAPPILIFLEDARRQAEQAQQLKLAAMGRLSAGIAHEIRNPLSAISHATQLLSESPALRDEERKLLAIVHRHSQRIDRIVEDVMGLSRRHDTESPSVQIKPWLLDTINEYRTLRDQPPELSLVHIGAGQRVRFYPPHLRRVLFNVWQNAERHARRPGQPLRITLSGNHDANGTFCLDNTDNGPGISAAASGHILEPFYTTDTEGTGLGLHVARELCESNGARLIPIADSHGACFRIQFASAPNTFDDRSGSTDAKH